MLSRPISGNKLALQKAWSMLPERAETLDKQLFREISDHALSLAGATRQLVSSAFVTSLTHDMRVERLNNSLHPRGFGCSLGPLHGRENLEI